MRHLSLNDRLHLVIPIYEGDTIVSYVHSTPISREVFEAHFMLVSKTFSQIYAQGLGIVAGPRVASLVLQQVAKDMDDQGGAMALLNEIRRLTNVVTRTPHGWESIPFQEAVDRKALNEDDLSEVTNGICFFTVASAMHRKQDLREVMAGAAKVWGAQTSSSDFTAFVASLETSNASGHTTKHPIPVSSVAF